MEVITTGKDINEAGLVAGIGFFDGVHRGHRSLISEISDFASMRGMGSAVITFREHPRKILHKHYRPALLNSTQEKLELLSSTGINYCILLDFTKKMAQMTAEEFLNFLYAEFNVRSLIIGYDHRFGHNRTDGFEQYKVYGQRIGMEIVRAKQFAPDGKHISSSIIRKLIGEEGKTDEAATLLSYPYSLKGIVISGHQVGRKLGFPTANLKLCDEEKVIPRPGVYAVRVHLDNGEHYNGMLNFGKRPTLDNGNNYTLEVHLFGYSGDLYGRFMEVSFIRFMRPEMKFESLDALKEQLQKDKEQAKSLLS